MSNIGLRYASAQAQIDPFGTARRDARIGQAHGGDDGRLLPSWWEALSIAGGAIGAYHGWKRDQSVGWAIGWGVLGVLFPVIVIPVAFAQGIDKRK